MVKKIKKIPPGNEGDADSISGWEDPLEKETATIPVLLPGKSRGKTEEPDG